MTQIATIEPQKKASLIQAMAAKVNMDAEKFAKTVRAMVMPRDHTDEQFAALLLVAHEYGLNPIVKEIYAFAAKGGGIVPIVSIDGWINLVNSHPKCNGFTFLWDHNDTGKIISCTCRMHRKDRDHPVEVTEYFDECYRDTDPWKFMPHRMMRHKAMIQAARYAFGFSGIYDEEEGAKIAEMRDVTSKPSTSKALPPPPPPPPPPVPVSAEHLPEPEPDSEPVGDETPEDLFKRAEQWGYYINDLDALEAYKDEFGQYLDGLGDDDRAHLQSIIDRTEKQAEQNLPGPG